MKNRGRRRIHALIQALGLAAVLLLSFPDAEASPFAACAVKPEQRTSAADPNGEFLKELHAQFQLFYKLSAQELKANRECLTSQEPPERVSEECQRRRRYFLEVIPVEWKKFRRELALSAWASGRGSERPYNSSLGAPEAFWITSVTPLPLGSPGGGDELAAVDREWENQWRMKKNETLEWIDTELKLIASGKRPGANGYESGLRNARSMIREMPFERLREIERKGVNPYVSDVFTRMEETTFLLNRKRLIQRLAAHPVLAHLREPQVSVPALLEAMRSQALGLVALKEETDSYFRGIKEQGFVRTSDLAPMLEYVTVIDTLLDRRPELCAVAERVFEANVRTQWLKTSAALAATVGVAMVFPPFWAALGLAAWQGASLVNDTSKLKDVSRAAYANVDPALNFKSSKDVYMLKTSLGTEALIAPSMVFGFPSALKAVKVLRFLSPVR